MIFLDFEVFRYDWLVVMMDTVNRSEHVIWNDRERLEEIYQQNKNQVWVGYNIRHYDQFIFKGILAGFDPWEVNEHIIVKERPGWAFSRVFNRIPLIIYDVMPNPPIGLKTLEGFMGSNIKESDVDFLIQRKLTESERLQTEEYCRSDVCNTIKVFCARSKEFDAMIGIVNTFGLPLASIGDTEARITAKVLGCQKQNFDDEFRFEILPCIKLKKYKHVQDWFESIRSHMLDYLEWHSGMTPEQGHASDLETIIKDFYKLKLEVEIAGVPHTFGFGGVHGARLKCHETGLILHVDVNNYYPSLLIAHGLVTRAATNDNYAIVYNTRWELKKKQMEAKTKEEAKKYKSAQLPYKKILNALSGAMKDKTSTAYDPRRNNEMTINGQLMLLMLIEMLEDVPGFKLIQSNTDGLIIKIDDTDEAFDMVDDICYEWETRCSTSKCKIGLAFDYIDSDFGIYQKDVNNYLFKFENGEIERKGAYVKPLNDLDYDLPIINEALVEYFVNGTPVQDTILGCTELRKFQKIVKLSEAYHHVEWECDGKRIPYTYKCYRVFASTNPKHGRLLKVRPNQVAKFGNTSPHCFIINGELTVDTEIPIWLDRHWYIQLAEERLKDFVEA